MSQILVRDFINQKVSIVYRDYFIHLMKIWDGSNNVLNSFYDEDILKIKLQEAKEKQ